MGEDGINQFETDVAGEPEEMVPEQSGLTPRTSLVILYGAFILMPANIYLLLVAGQSLITPIHFIALILWVEMCKFSRKPLTTAEAFIVYSISGVAAGQLLFYLYAIHPAYFLRDFNSTCRDERHPMRPAQRVELDGLSIEITRVDREGLLATADRQFLQGKTFSSCLFNCPIDSSRRFGVARRDRSCSSGSH